MTVVLSNNVASVLAANIADNSGSLTVTDASRFPTISAGQYFYATLISTTGAVEIVKVISRNGNAMGITRGQEGTPATAFAAGSRVELRVTARSVLDAIDDNYQATLPVINAAVSSANASAAAAAISATTATNEATAAELSADDAQVSADLALTRANAAAASASSAGVSADASVAASYTAISYAAQASAASNSAFINANVYANVAAGVAATAVSGQFQVIVGSEIIRYRVDAGPVAVEVARFNIPTSGILFDPFVIEGFHIVDPYGFATLSLASTSVFTDIDVNVADISLVQSDFYKVTNSDPYWAVVDDYGFAALYAGSTGLNAPALVTDNATVETLIADWQETANVSPFWSVVDEYGITTAEVRDNGIHALRVVEYTPDTNPTWTYENHIVLSMGQSLAIGVNATPVLTTTQPYNTKMLSSGVRTYSDSPYSAATLAALIEAADAEGGETPLGGAALYLNELILREDQVAYNQHSFAVLGAATGVGSTAIADHVSGTPIFTRAVDVVTRMHNQSLAADTTAACLGVFWIQGESDVATAQATYQTTLQTMRSDLSTSIQGATGQTEPVKMFTYQTASHLAYSQATPNSALAQLAAANADANIYLSTPMYHLEYSDGVHMTNNSSRQLGAYMALAYKRVIIDGLDWKPLQPKAHIRQGSVCILTFDVPTGPLVLDTVSVSDPGNYGFALVNSAGSPLTISSVTLAGPDRIKIVAAATIPSGAKVRYAWGNGITANSGPRTGARGCLRDSAGNYLPATYGKMHNWCVIFERSI